MHCRVHKTKYFCLDTIQDQTREKERKKKDKIDFSIGIA